VGVCPDIRGEAAEITRYGAVPAWRGVRRGRPAHWQRRVRDFGLRGRAERLRRPGAAVIPMPRPAPPEWCKMAACGACGVEVVSQISTHKSGIPNDKNEFKQRENGRSCVILCSGVYRGLP